MWKSERSKGNDNKFNLNVKNSDTIAFVVRCNVIRNLWLKKTFSYLLKDFQTVVK